MILYPAIDLFEGKAVRLLKGDYDKMTVYSDNPVEIGADFKNCGAEAVHIVDLEAARKGVPCNLDLILEIKKATGLFVEVGGGIRTMELIERYLDAGIDRVILGTAAVENRTLLKEAVNKYGSRIAVGVDIKDGFVSIKGWTENSDTTADDFFKQLCDIGVSTVICTDISRDGMMKGSNNALYKELKEKYSIQIIASGGVSSLSDISELNAADLYGAIIGKAYYTGAIDLKEAVRIVQ